MNARQLILEKKRPTPDPENTLGIYADYSHAPEVKWYVKCPKCGEVHGTYKSMREAHAKRLCDRCNIKAINDLKDAIQHVDDPDQRDKEPKGTTKMFHEAQDPDDIDPQAFIDKQLLANWIVTSIEALRAELGEEVSVREGYELPEDPDTETLIRLEAADGTEWDVYKSDSDAEAAALEQVKNDLDNEPGIFTQDWLEGFINTERLNSLLIADRNFRDDFMSSYRDEDERVDYLIKHAYLNEDDFWTPTGRRRKMSPARQKKVDAAIDAWVEKQEEEFDGMDWLRDIYGNEEAAKEAIRIAGFDRDRAAQSAIDTDGWQHFLARYDGNSTDLSNDAVAVRVN